MHRAIIAAPFVLYLSGCGGQATPDSQEQWTIAPYLASCGYIPQTGCLVRQESGYNHHIYGIEGLDWRWGTGYRLTVETTERDFSIQGESALSSFAVPPSHQHHLIEIHSVHEDEVGTRYEYPNIVLSHGVFDRYASASYFLGYEYQCALQTQSECDFIHDLERTGVEQHLALVFQYQGDGAIALVEATFIDEPEW